MTEGERIELYNNLCDFRDELNTIFPLPSQKIHTLSQAIIFVRGTTAKWERSDKSEPIIVNGRAIGSTNCTCSTCGVIGRSDYRLCPNCGAKMHN